MIHYILILNSLYNIYQNSIIQGKRRAGLEHQLPLLDHLHPVPVWRLETVRNTLEYWEMWNPLRSILVLLWLSVIGSDRRLSKWMELRINISNSSGSPYPPILPSSHTSRSHASKKPNSILGLPVKQNCQHASLYSPCFFKPHLSAIPILFSCCL